MNRVIQSHIKHMARYPNARPSTIANIIKREAKHEQLRREIKSHPWWAFWRRK